MRWQGLIIISVALTFFLMGTMFSAMAVERENPFDTIWQAIHNLQGRVENVEESLKGTSNANIEKFINEVSRVELLRVGGGDGGLYYYYYGVSGHWNITRMQTESLIEALDSTVTGALMYCEAYDNTYYSLQPEYKGYERLVMMTVNRELTPTEIEQARLTIREYLAHL